MNALVYIMDKDGAEDQNRRYRSLKRNPVGFFLIFFFLPQGCSSAPIREKAAFFP